jgi:hypothetical protein
VKNKIAELFLFRHRFILGYILIGIIFLSLLLFLPSIAPQGISSKEMQAAVSADQINFNFVQDGHVVDLPYYGIQKLCLKIFGLTLYSIKLPSIIFGTLTAFFLVLLLNRWYKSDVALIGSALTTLSTAFLCLANFGTPSIMYLFWLAFILWLGSKIVGNKNIHPFFVILFTSAVAFSLYTPYLCYVALIILIAGLIHPHLRASLKRLKPYQFVIGGAILVLALCPLIISASFHPGILKTLAFTDNFSFASYKQNINDAFAPFFSFALAYDSVYLAPLFGLGTVALIVIGAISSLDRLFTSRNAITIAVTVFAIVISGLCTETSVIIIVPIAIMTAAAIDTMTTHWKTIFPKNPYAHVVGAIPLVAILGLMLFSGLSHYIRGYHYTPRVTKNFNSDITIIQHELESGDILIVNNDNENLDFYKLLEKYNDLTVTTELPEHFNSKVAVLGSTKSDDKLQLSKIAVSSKSRNSDRLYIYTKATEKEQETGEE